MNAQLMGPLAAFSTSAIWAVASPLYAKITARHGPFATNFSRALAAWLAALVVLALRYASGTTPILDPATANWHAAGWLSISILTSYGIGDSLFFVAASRVGFSTALAIGSSFPIWSAFADWLFRGRGLSAAQIAGLLLIVAGVVTVVLLGKRQSEISQKGYAKWIAISFGVSLLWAATAFCTSQAGTDLDPVLATLIRMTAGIPLIILFSGRAPYRLPWSEFVRGLPLFALEGFGGAWAYVYGLSNSPLAAGSALCSLAPVLSVPVAIVLGLERPSAARLSAVAAVVAGIWFLLGISGS